MFVRVYWRIATTLIASTLALLIIVGVAVYGVLNQLVQHDEETGLTADSHDVQEAVHLHSLQVGQPIRRWNYENDSGQHDYFIVYKGAYVAAESREMPVPIHIIKGLGDKAGYRYVMYNNEPYRVKLTTWNTPHGGTFHLAIFNSIETEERLLRHVITLISEIGTAGMVLAVAFNLWFGNKVLKPARDVWDAHQTLLIELSHELQTPLATMHAIATQVDKPDLRDRLRQETMDASNLVSDIMYLSKLRVLPKEMYEPVAVSDITDEVVERMALLSERRGVSLAGNAVPGLYVLTSTEAWSRLVSTLFKNVADHALEDSAATWSLRADDDMISLRIDNRYDEAVEGLQDGKTPQSRFGMTIVRRLVGSMDGRAQFDVNDGWFRATVTVPSLRP